MNKRKGTQKDNSFKILKTASNALLPARSLNDVPHAGRVIKKETSENDDPKSSIEVFTANGLVNKSTVNISEVSQDITYETEANAVSCVKKEPLEHHDVNNVESRGNIHQIEIRPKRKPDSDIQEKLKFLREKITRVNTNTILASSESSNEDFTCVSDKSPDRVFTTNGQVNKSTVNISEVSQDITYESEANAISCVKKEPLEHQDTVLASPESSIEDFTCVSDKSADKVFPSNGQINKSPLNISEVSIDITYESEVNTVSCIKKASFEDHDVNSVESQENLNQIDIRSKRKPEPDFQGKINVIRKRIKVEPVAESQNLSALVNANQSINFTPVHEDTTENDHAKKGQVDDKMESSQDEQNNDVLLLPQLEKDVEMITLSDGEGDHNSGSPDVASPSVMKSTESPCIPSQPSTSTPIAKRKEKNFSTDILRYFSVTSELDRHDCISALKFLSKYKTKNSLEYIFPSIKREKRSKDEIKKGDILFRQEVSASETNCDIRSINSELVSQRADEFVSLDNNFRDPSTFQSTQFLPERSLSTNFELYMPPNLISPSTSYSNIEEGDSSPAHKEIEQIIKYIRFENTLMSSKRKDKVAVADHNQRLSFQEPRCENNLHNLQNGNSFLVANNDPRVRSRPVHNFQRVSVDPITAKAHFEQPSSSKMGRDSCATFPPRKGGRDLPLYRNGGNDYITGHFERFVLQWKPAWLRNQESMNALPPICVSYPCVQTSYSNQRDYCNTYVPLHLLHIWCQIFQCWSGKTVPVIKGICESVDRLDNGFEIKITCFTELKTTENGPEWDDIALCKHNAEESFIRLKSVKNWPTESDTKTKLKICFESVRDLKLEPGDSVEFRILFNIHMACVTAEALKSLHTSMKEVVVKPNIYADSIEVVEFFKEMNTKVERDEILKAVDLNDTRVVVAVTYLCDTLSLITHLAFTIAVGQSNDPPKDRPKVLICLKNEAMLKKIFSRLSNYKPLLLVRTKQIKLAKNLYTQTFEKLMEEQNRNPSDLNERRIYMCTYSAFGSAEKEHLSNEQNLICIMADAHLCTEVETALPLTLNLHKLLLIGNRAEKFTLPEVLMESKYNCTLFSRFLKAKHFS